MHLFLEPVDVWLFRDGRSFDAGSDHRAVSFFPPYPTVMQGAIRSHYLVIKNVNLKDAKAISDIVGTVDCYKDLRMRGPFLAKKEDNGKIVRYLPVPADIFPAEDGVQSLSPCKIPDGIIASNVTPNLLLPTGKPKKVETGNWLPEYDLKQCLEGKKVKPVADHDLFVRESRIGIDINDYTRTTEQGKLYEVEFIRPQEGVGLLVEVSGYRDWPDNGIMRIGGEGRGAFFTKVDDVCWCSPPNPLPGLFKIYFASPTYFNAGWKPNDWSQFFEGDVELKAAAVNRYESVGGYDWANNAHKPARRYVPAGSVYYFESKGEARLKTDLIQGAITDFGAEIGFGQIIVKEWNNV
ncbi:MAG: type III-B CRISPR module-associated protein Cmr3 [Armatimonadota bacterium]|nr:type III-B CRISPR module-associated protein Cmr3 [Armatimonadota bacterium]